jgi:hypothetical protein
VHLLFQTTQNKEIQVTGSLEPKSETRRRTEEAIEVATALVPFAGGVLSVKYAQAFRRADQRRFEQWQHQMESALDAVAERVEGLSVDALFEDDAFVDSLAAATRIAEKNTDVEKRAALQNALVNIGAGNAPDVDKRTIYLGYIDVLTPSHMQLMRFLDDPVAYLNERDLAWPNVMMGGLISVVEVAFPAWARDEAFLMTLAGDLGSRNLVQSPGFNTVMTGEGLKAQRSTPKGHEFMRFISGPFT